MRFKYKSSKNLFENCFQYEKHSWGTKSLTVLLQSVHYFYYAVTRALSLLVVGSSALKPLLIRLVVSLSVLAMPLT